MATKNLSQQNFFSTTLAQDVTASSTTIYVSSVPTVTEGYLVLEKDSSSKREIIYFTSIGANFVTCPDAVTGRGVGGTTAQAHTAGVSIDMTNVAEFYKAVKDGTALNDDIILNRHLGSGIIGNAELLTTAGDIGGAWLSWTPTWTGLTVGSGIVGAKYTKIGKTVIGNLRFVFGSGSAITGNLSFTLPLTAANSNVEIIGPAMLTDAGSQFYDAVCFRDTSTIARIYAKNASGAYVYNVALSSTIPFGTAWGSPDEINTTFIYEAA